MDMKDLLKAFTVFDGIKKDGQDNMSRNDLSSNRVSLLRLGLARSGFVL